MSPTNSAASVRARLLNHARATDHPFQEILQLYAMERFLHRLSLSQHRDKFILKGALMLRVWDTPISRPTRDIDLLGRLDNTLENLASSVRDILQTEAPADGLRFDEDSIRAERISADADYQGVRVRFEGRLDTARIAMQIDVGFSDVITPDPSEFTYPTILDMDAPRLRGYPRETVIAEKFEAMVHLGRLNSRIKDFYDIWLLPERFDFDGGDLARAMEATFKQRHTDLETAPIALQPEFAESDRTRKQWQAFTRKGRLTNAPSDFTDVTKRISEFVAPVARRCSERELEGLLWPAGGPWNRR